MMTGTWDEQTSRAARCFDPKLMDDDPRFALWAARKDDNSEAIVLCSRHGDSRHDAKSVKEGVDKDAVPWMAGQKGGHGASSRTSVSSSEANASTKAGKHARQSTTSDQSQLAMLFPTGGAFLIAASMPTIVAELTSHIDNRFLTDFFYTYRAYVTPHELLRLLIARFHWTLDVRDGAVDEAQRNIIRVRTYVVIKYWLTNFFTIDFLPSRALRTQLTDWLNNYTRMHATTDGLRAGVGIIRNLKKIVRNLKAAYEQTGINGLLMADEAKTPRVLSESTSQPDSIDEAGQEGCVSLELGDEGQEAVNTPSHSQTRSPSDGKKKTNPTSPAGSSRWQTPQTPLLIGPQHAPPPLPTSQSAISRAFMSTFSRFSRLKRHLNARSSVNPFLSDGIDGSDFDTNNCGDLLFIRGGLEGFLDYFELRRPQLGGVTADQGWSEGGGATDESQDHAASDGATVQDEETPSLSSNQTRSTPASSFDLSHGSPINLENAGTFGLGITRGEMDDEVGLALSHDETDMASGSLLTKPASPDLLHHFQSDQTLRSASRGQRQRAGLTQIEQSPTRNALPNKSNANNVVLIDDVDLSSDEDDGVVRKALRRLPAARNLRTATRLDQPVRQSFDSVSSFGQVHDQSRRSLASYFGHAGEDDAAAVQAHITSVVTSEMLDPDEALRGFELVKGFRLNDLEDSDDDEPGDVEAALRRLEGVLDVDKERERARKVENMWQRSQARLPESQAARAHPAQRDSVAETEGGRPGTVRVEGESTGASSHGDNNLPASGSNATVIIRPDQTIDPNTVPIQKTAVTGEVRLPRSVWAPPPVHRSFLLDYRADVMAQQFSLIESELFRAVSWQELVSGQWKVKQHAGPVWDWESFYQTRARNRVQAQRHGGPAAEVTMESSVEAITARFKLMCNWVASEIVLTNSVEARAAVIRKLIRVAWRCYHYSNFATLTQIILGLQVPSVERLTKTWAKVGALEMRMLRDLEAFINPAHNFKHLRNAMRDMMIQGHMEDLIISSGPPQSASSKNMSSSSSRSGIMSNDGCIPFFGLFLADLAVHDALPAFVDPSSPDAEVEADTTTDTMLQPAEPEAFAHLPGLPEGVVLTPLVNLYKFRILSMTVKSILALQERLEAFNFPINRGVYVKSLKLRSLEPAQMTIISHMAES